jgi:UDP-N-acetylmuramoyl-tripeptide--D-alanyl-D-alanine ligase
LSEGRRIGIIGDMLELGDEAAAYHAGLVSHLDGIDGVYCVGPLMRHLFDVLPAEKRLGWHDDPATLEPAEVAALLKRGDLVVIKGSKKIFWVNKFVPRLAAALQQQT